MSTLSTVNTITTQTLQYAPAVVAGIQAAETAGQATSATGASKQASVVSGILAGVQVGSGDLEQSSNPTVAGVAALVNLFVSIFNSLGLFTHKAKAAA